MTPATARVCVRGENKLGQVWPKRFVAISLLVYSTPLCATLHSIPVCTKRNRKESKGGAKLFLLMHLSPFSPHFSVCESAKNFAWPSAKQLVGGKPAR